MKHKRGVRIVRDVNEGIFDLTRVAMYNALKNGDREQLDFIIKIVDLNAMLIVAASILDKEIKDTDVV